MNTTRALKTYTNIGIESSLETADSHKLVLLLYQGALLAIAKAKNQMIRKETANKGASISHAIAIIESGLQASLDKNAGGELAHNLSSLYEYMIMRLIAANLKNDMATLDEVARLLADLKEAWESIRPNTVQTTPQPKPASTTQLVYGRV